MTRIEKLKHVIDCIHWHRSNHGVQGFGDESLRKAKYELYTLGAGSAPEFSKEITKPLTMREGDVRQALRSMAIWTHQTHRHDEGKPIVGFDNYPLVVGAEARLFRVDGRAIKGANGKIRIEGVQRTKKYQGGLVSYRVMAKISTGTASAATVKLVKPTNASRQDAVRDKGRPPSNRGYKAVKSS